MLETRNKKPGTDIKDSEAGPEVDEATMSWSSSASSSDESDASSSSSSSSCSSSSSSESESSLSDGSDNTSISADSAIEAENILGATDAERTERYLNALRKPGTNTIVARRTSERTAGINGTEMLRLVLNEGVRPPRERKARFHQASLRLRRTRHGVNVQAARDRRAQERSAAIRQIEEYEAVRKEQKRLEMKKAKDEHQSAMAEDLSDDQLLQEYVMKKERERRVTVVGGVATFEKIAVAVKGPTREEIKEGQRRKSLATARRASLAGKRMVQASQAEDEHLKKAQGEFAALW